MERLSLKEEIIIKDIRNLFIDSKKNQPTLQLKMQLTITNNLISSTYNGNEHVMHSKNDNMEIMIDDEADEVIKEIFDSLKNRHQNNLESMNDGEFFFDYIQLFHYKCHKINPNCGRLYIDSLDYIKNKNTAINPINKKDKKCFQYAVTVALNQE